MVRGLSCTNPLQAAKDHVICVQRLKPNDPWMVPEVWASLVVLFERRRLECHDDAPEHRSGLQDPGI